MIGRVYKLCSDDCDKVYIGSTYSKYPSVRMAHHRQNHRNGWKNYQGLFDNGEPRMEILEEIELESRDEAYKLRELEQKYFDEYGDNIINVRRCYLSPEERIKQRDLSINKYHKTPLGKLAMRKSALNTKLKKAKSKTLHPTQIKTIENELKFICEHKEFLRSQAAIDASDNDQ